MAGHRTRARRAWTVPDLRSAVAVVTGASRGAGRGIACVPGEAGATVYVTGRSARGGLGIPVRCDHTVDAEVEALFRRVRQERGRLDILVNNAWGGCESPSSPTAHLCEMITCCKAGGRGWSSLREKPALRNMRSYSENV